MLLLANTALFNHSCLPNAAVYAAAEGECRVQVRMIRDVAEGQEVAICYDSALLSREREYRQQQLMARWGFRCGCPRCRTPDDPTDALLTAARLPAGPARSQLELEFHTCCGEAESAINTATNVLHALAEQDAQVRVR
jgi:hypothetical protein